MARVLKHAPESIIVSAWILVTVTGHAQSGKRPDADVLADLRACGTLARDGARLACFDGVLAAGAGEPPSEPRDRDVLPEPSSAAAPVRESLRAPAASSVPRASAAAPATRAGTRERSEAPEERDDEGRRTVTIVEINEMLSGEASFLTATGQVYVQTSGGTPAGGYPDVPYETTLRDGALGSLFLYITDRRRVRVRRVE